MDNNACLYEGGDMDFMFSMCRHKQVEYRLRNISLMPPKMKFMVHVDSHNLFMVAKITSVVDDYGYGISISHKLQKL